MTAAAGTVTMTYLAARRNSTSDQYETDRPEPLGTTLTTVNERAASLNDALGWPKYRAVQGELCADCVQHATDRQIRNVSWFCWMFGCDNNACRCDNPTAR